MKIINNKTSFSKGLTKLITIQAIVDWGIARILRPLEKARC
jgi:hypothetical protein